MKFQGDYARLFRLFLILIPICLGTAAKVRVDTLTGTFVTHITERGFSRKFCPKSPPYYPMITQREIDSLVGMGLMLLG